MTPSEMPESGQGLPGTGQAVTGPHTTRPLRERRPAWRGRCSKEFVERNHILAYDDYVPALSTTYMTSSNLDLELGKYDQLALFLVLTQVPGSPSGTANFYVWISHSGDGETFVTKNSTGGPPPAQPEIQISWGTTAPNSVVAWGSDPNSHTNPPTPLHKYVRLNLYMTNVSSRVHARIYVTQRDQGG